jgi:hypothetical protein
MDGGAGRICAGVVGNITERGKEMSGEEISRRR